MVVHEAVPLTTEAQVDLADPADVVRPYDVTLPAAVLAALVRHVERDMVESVVKAHRSMRRLAPLPPDGLGSGWQCRRIVG